MEFDLDKWITTKRNANVLIEHIGDFSISDIDSILPEIEQKLHDTDGMESMKKKTFHIFVECIQNLYHHMEPFESVAKNYGNEKLGVVVMTKDQSECRITTGNFIRKSKCHDLQERINYINLLSDSERRVCYRETMTKKDYSDKGGAGVGMLDIARRSGNKLEYEFYTVKNQPQLLFFSFGVCIS